MPAPSLKSLAKDYGVSEKDAERYWNETIKLANEEFGKGKDKFGDREWKWVMGVVKQRLNNKRKGKNESVMREMTEPRMHNVQDREYMNPVEMNELKMYIINDGDLYRQRVVPMINNLQKKLAKGQYDHNMAPKMWLYLVDEGAKKYVRDFGGNLQMMFPKKDRMVLAKDLADYYWDEISYDMQESTKVKKGVSMNKALKEADLRGLLTDDMGDYQRAIKLYPQFRPAINRVLKNYPFEVNHFSFEVYAKRTKEYVFTFGFSNSPKVNWIDIVFTPEYGEAFVEEYDKNERQINSYDVGGYKESRKGKTMKKQLKSFTESGKSADEWLNEMYMEMYPMEDDDMEIGYMDDYDMEEDMTSGAFTGMVPENPLYPQDEESKYEMADYSMTGPEMSYEEMKTAYEAMKRKMEAMEVDIDVEDEDEMEDEMDVEESIYSNYGDPSKVAYSNYAEKAKKKEQDDEETPEEGEEMDEAEEKDGEDASEEDKKESPEEDKKEEKKKKK